MIASLPMYWRAETAEGWCAFWRLVQDGTNLPDLTPPADLPADLVAHWLSPDLALSMTCGLPFRSVLRDRVTYVGTLDFGLGDAPGHYHSVIIRRPDSTPAILAYNSPDSQSGWAAAQGLPFTATLQTGSHAASLAALAEGRADIACIDVVTWRLLSRTDPNAALVEVAGRTAPTPGLPLITTQGHDPAPLRDAIQAGLARWQPADPMQYGGPLSFHILPENAYLDQPVPTPPLPNNSASA